MKMKVALLLMAVLLAIPAIPAVSELQNVTVGGQIHIRGNYYSASSGAGDHIRAKRNPSTDGLFPPYSAADLRYGAISGRQQVTSPFTWDNRGHNNRYTNMRTRLKFSADFTNDVSGVIELDNYSNWGEDFRSEYLTGSDAAGTDNVNLFQAYIQADNMFGVPLTLRVGRQEVVLGNGWLIGNQDNGVYMTGISYDAIMVKYTDELWNVAGFFAKPLENGPVEEDGDIDVYGIYGGITPNENISIEPYWMFVRDARSMRDTANGPLGDWLEGVFDVDDYDPTNLHTIGIRNAGKVDTGEFGTFDFNVEAAYQFGNADAIGATFGAAAGVPVGFASPYGDDSAVFQEWATNMEFGYTFKTCPWTPRVFVGYSYYSGEDNRDMNFWEWMGYAACPWVKPKASTSFNRLMSNTAYDEFIDWTDFTNGSIQRAGVSVNPTDKLNVLVTAFHFDSNNAFRMPSPNWAFNPFGFSTRKGSQDLGWETAIYVTYKYTEDLEFGTGWAHLFTGEGLRDGNYNNGNGLIFNGGTDRNDADYLFVDAKLTF
jgi:hypothetical protein